MPRPGEFVVHSRAVPPLGAGDYTLHGSVDIPPAANHPVEQYSGHLRITSPRYRMPPDQIMSTFPPANAEGSFESRLPQIVLKRRTLPWERVVDPGRREIPWLALVVIAEGEGELSGEVPIAQCVTPGVSLSGPNDVPTGLYLSVPMATVAKVFPTKDDLQLLVHVREVDIEDTELAMGDDDGFLAVVLANRLPQFDRVQCRPVRYLACLINLEGQLGVLPPQTPPVDDFFADVHVFDARVLEMPRDTDISHMGGGATVTGDLPTTVVSASPGRAGAMAGREWEFQPARIEELAVSSATEDAARMVRDYMGAGWRISVEGLVEEPVYRFPVLAHWSFTCTGAGSFETLMQGLDVGLLGTLPGDAAGRQRPPCEEPPGGDAPPGAPTVRPDPEVTETGHAGLPYLTRRGEPLRSWYRGPFTPRMTEREQPDNDGRLPLAHTSDRLRRVVPDGREDLSQAAAFEIGRLLALSQPSVIAALMRWRREQFGAERARRLTNVVAGDAGLFAGALAGRAGDLGALIGRELVLAAAARPTEVLGPPRPPCDPGRPLEFLGADIDDVIARGFGIPREAVRQLRATGDPGVLRSVDVPRADVDVPIEDGVGHLRDVLTDTVDRLAGETLTRDRDRDALDDALGAAARDRMEEIDR